VHSLSSSGGIAGFVAGHRTLVVGAGAHRIASREVQTQGSGLNCANSNRDLLADTRELPGCDA
jgi:hypothetical protein